jgi:MFS transporter, NNP family, nitrate/nitrite transporter
MVVACFAGFGGGNFASSMTNINAFFPERDKGWALGLNAGGGGNIGVPVIQLVALLVIATAGAGYPRIILTVYIPLIVVAAVLAALNMDNISSVRNDTGAFQESIREHHTWIMAFLYIGTSARSSATASPSVSCCRTSSAAPRCRPRPSPSSGRCSGP